MTGVWMFFGIVIIVGLAVAVIIHKTQGQISDEEAKEE